MFPPFAKGQVVTVVVIELWSNRRALIDQQVDGIGRVGAFAEQKIELAILVPVHHRGSEQVCPKVPVFGGADDRRIDRIRLVKLGNVFCPGVLDQEQFAAEIADDQIENAFAVEICQRAFLSPAAVDVPAKARQEHRDHLAIGELWRGLGAAVEINPVISLRIDCEEVQQTIAVQVGHLDGNRHVDMADVSAFGNRFRAPSRSGKTASPIHPVPEIVPLGKTLETGIGNQIGQFSRFWLFPRLDHLVRRRFVLGEQQEGR